MEFFVVFKSEGKLEFRRSASEYTMLSMVTEQIENEDIDLRNPKELVQYIGFLPTGFDDLKKYVDYTKEKNTTNQPLLAIFHTGRNDVITKVFRRGIPDLTNFIKSSNIVSFKEEFYCLNKEFKSFDELVDDTTRNAIGRLVMNKGFDRAVSELKYEYVGARISIKKETPVMK